MKLSIMVEPQIGMTYDDLLAIARRTEDLGLAGLYRSDHYSSGKDDELVDSTDAWATLAALARDTTRLTFGTLVTPATFRTIGSLAKTVATVHEMAGPAPDGGSRVALGMGTGWMKVEHERHGFPFEDIDTRFRRLEEHLEVLTRLWDPDSQPFDFDGAFVSIKDGRFAPVPQPRPRIILGGAGMRRTPALAARFADELNGVFLSLEQCRRQRQALHEGCRDIGRDPATVAYSLMTRCVVGATAADFEARAAAMHARSGSDQPLEEWIAALDPGWITGTPDRVAAQLDDLAEAGVDQVMLQHLDYDDLDMLDVVAEHLA